MTTKNIGEAEEQARLDLQWMIADGLCDAIEVEGSAAARNQFALSARLLASGRVAAQETFTIPWGSNPRA